MIDKKLLDSLEQCLSTIVSKDEHLSVDEIRGLFYAQMITPDKSDMLVWMSALFYGERPKLNEEQITTLNACVGAAYEAYYALFAANQLKFPYDFDYLDEKMAESAYAWCQGFYIGLLVTEELWFGKKGEKLRNTDKELETIRNSAKLFMGLINKDFSSFDRNKLAELKALIIEQGQQVNDDVIAASLFPNVPTAVKTLQNHGVKLMQAALKKTQSQPSVKIGRNDPCHCGSGKKYKKCCG